MFDVLPSILTHFDGQTRVLHHFPLYISIEKRAQNGISGKSRVAGPKMTQFSKNGFFCVLHTYFQDLKGARILPDQKWEILPTLLLLVGKHESCVLTSNRCTD